MSLIALIVILAVVGVGLWWLTTYVPMDGTVKRIITAIVVLVVILWVLSALGVLGAVNEARVPRLD